MTIHPRDILKDYGVSPKRSLGQNFLFDDNILARIVGLAELEKDHSVLEIGPGIGSLTRCLAPLTKSVVAVEIDDRLIPILEDQLQNYQNVTIRHEDILKFEPSRHFDKSYSVVVNVPYYITGAILRHIYDFSELSPDLAILTVQQEVAKRLIAKPGKMSLLSTSVQYYAEIEMGFTIKAGSFWPKPEVDSAVVCLRSRSNRLIETQREKEFFRLIRVGYSQKRKQLQKNLRSLGFPRDYLQASFLRSGIDGSRRAETLSLKEWQLLFDELF